MSQLLVGTDLSATHALGAALTTVFFLTFLGWTWWAYSPANAARHEADGRIPFDGEGDLPQHPATDGGIR